MSQLNPQIQEALDSKQLEKAQELLVEALKEANAKTYYLAAQVALDDEQKESFYDKARETIVEDLKNANADTYYLAAQLALDAEQKNGFLKKVLELNPFHKAAHAELKAETKPQAVVVEKKEEAPKPKAEAPKEQSPQESYLTGTVGTFGTTRMLMIPSEFGQLRTEIRQKANVYVIARYENSNKEQWLQVIYKSPATNVIGWLRANDVKNLNVNGREVNFLDLPITDFQFNKRAEFVEAKNKAYWRANVVGGVEYLKVVIVGTIVIGLLILMTGNAEDMGGPVGAFIAGLFLTGLFGWIFMFFMPSYMRVYREYNELNRLQKNMRSNYEVMRDDQRMNMAMGAALNLGVNMGTRMVADRKDITVRRR